jgi:hypothetical protein
MHADTVKIDDLSTALQDRCRPPKPSARARCTYVRTYVRTYLLYLLTYLLHSFDLARYYLHSTRHDLAAISTLLRAGAKGLGSRLVCGS